MPAVSVRDEGHVRYITLDRPEKMNALNNELAWGVITALEEAACDDNVWVVGLTGSGRAFCAGLDLTGGGDDVSPLPPLTRQLDDLGWVSRILLVCRHACDKPIVAGINGVAVGGGLALAMAADIRIMKRSARLMAGYPRIGGSPDGGLSFTLPEAMNYEQSMRFLLENRTVQGDEALALGLVGDVVDDDTLRCLLHVAHAALPHYQPADQAGCPPGDRQRRSAGPRALRSPEHPRRLR